MNLSNAGFLEAFRLVRDVLGEGIYLGGGGYNPVALARAWSLVWCEISGREIPESLNAEARKLLLNVDWENPLEDIGEEHLYLRLRDSWRGGGVRESIRNTVAQARNLLCS